MDLAAHSGLETMSSVETNPKERGLGKPCAGKPPARFDEGESIASGNRLAALSTLLIEDALQLPAYRVKRGQFKGRRLAWIQQGGREAMGLVLRILL